MANGDGVSIEAQRNSAWTCIPGRLCGGGEYVKTLADEIERLTTENSDMIRRLDDCLEVMTDRAIKIRDLTAEGERLRELLRSEGWSDDGIRTHLKHPASVSGRLPEKCEGCGKPFTACTQSTPECVWSPPVDSRHKQEEPQNKRCIACGHPTYCMDYCSEHDPDID